MMGARVTFKKHNKNIFANPVVGNRAHENGLTQLHIKVVGRQMEASKD